MNADRRNFVFGGVATVMASMLPSRSPGAALTMQDIFSTYQPPFRNILREARDKHAPGFALRCTTAEQPLTGDIVVATGSLLETHIPGGVLGGYLPCGLSDESMSALMSSHGGLKIIQKQALRLGYNAHYVGCVTNVSGLWSRVDLENLDRFDGLNCMGSGLANKVFQYLGANDCPKPLVSPNGQLNIEEYDVFQWTGPESARFFPFEQSGFRYYLFQRQAIASGSAVLLLSAASLKNVSVDGLVKQLRRSLKSSVPIVNGYAVMSPELADRLRAATRMVASESLPEITGSNFTKAYISLLA